MRFPKLTQLDKDQAKVYQGAPTTGTILVMGPPGTGKTVIAFHRAHSLKKLGQVPNVVMFGKVLRKYTSNRQGVAPDVDVSTFHSWTAGWWRRSTGQFRAPTVPGKPYDQDWGEMQRILLAGIASGNVNKMNFGHLIIDEGQDFPHTMYSTLHTLMAVANSKEAKPPLAMTVLADENQRLQPGRNSTLENIRQALGLHASAKNVFGLNKNYRNTLQIAKFASHFYVGLQTGMPELPSQRQGALPGIYTSDLDTAGRNLNAFVERIARHAKNRPTEEIGVLVPNNNVRKSIVNRLGPRLKGTNVTVQSYASNDPDASDEDLEFDEPGHVTVLNFQSAKGLEFDTVFVVDPGHLISGGSSELDAKMTLYVMCSRARTNLELMVVEDEGLKKLLSWLPKAEGQYRLEKL